jgi:hypothetical protein
MGLSFGYGPAVEKQARISLICATVERGVTFFARGIRNICSSWWAAERARVYRSKRA